MERENDTLMCAEPAAAYAVCPRAYAAPPVMRVVMSEDYDEDEEEYEPWPEPTPEEIEWINKQIERAEANRAAGRFYRMRPGESLSEFLDRTDREGYEGIHS